MEGVIISSRRCYCWVYLHQFSYFFFQGAFTHLEPFLAVLFLFLPWNILAEKGQWCVFLSVITLSNDWIDWRLTNLIIIISSTSPPLHIVTTQPSFQINSRDIDINTTLLPCRLCPVRDVHGLLGGFPLYRRGELARADHHRAVRNWTVWNRINFHGPSCRFCGGVGLGLTLSVTPVYLVEVSSVTTRGMLGVVPPLFTQVLTNSFQVSFCPASVADRSDVHLHLWLLPGLEDALPLRSVPRLRLPDLRLPYTWGKG